MANQNDIAQSSPAGLAYVHSGGKIISPPHIHRLNKALLDVAGGRIKRLIVSVPPQYGKSTLISKYFPAWFEGNYPEEKIILATYEANFAASWGAAARDVLCDCSEIFPRSRIVGGRTAAASWWRTTAGGHMLTAGVGGPITGKGGNLIIDDPVKNAEEAFSATYRQGAKDWLNSTALTRLPPGGWAIILMTRWHDDDLAGYCLKDPMMKAEGWQHIRLPAIAEPKDILGRKEGEALWPARYSLESLAKVKARGEYWWSSMYQQNPVPATGGIFKKQWWKYYSKPPVGIIRKIWTWDTAVKDGEENDWSVGQLWAECADGYYLLRVVRKKMLYPELLDRVKMEYSLFKTNAILVEDKSSGQQLIQSLTNGTRLPLILDPEIIKPVNDKVVRANLVTPMIQSGRVFLPQEAEWLPDFLEELSIFPKGPNDDQVDTLTLALKYFSGLYGANPSSVWPGSQPAPANDWED